MGKIRQWIHKVWDSIRGDALWHIFTEVKRYFLGSWGVRPMLAVLTSLTIGTWGAFQAWIHSQPTYIVVTFFLVILTFALAAMNFLWILWDRWQGHSVLNSNKHIPLPANEEQHVPEWQPLTPTQRRILHNLLTESSKFPPSERRIRIFSLTLLDCLDLAKTLSEVFSTAEWNVEIGSSQEPNIHTRYGIGIYHTPENLYANTLRDVLQKNLDCLPESLWIHEEKEEEPPPPGWPRIRVPLGEKKPLIRPLFILPPSIFKPPPPSATLAIFVSRKLY